MRALVRVFRVEKIVEGTTVTAFGMREVDSVVQRAERVEEEEEAAIANIVVRISLLYCWKADVLREKCNYFGLYREMSDGEFWEIVHANKQ